MPKKFTEDSNLKEILEKKGTEKILAKYNLPCLSCPMAKFEIENLKIGQVCKMYGIDVKKLLKELNPVRDSRSKKEIQNKHISNGVNEKLEK